MGAFDAGARWRAAPCVPCTGHAARVPSDSGRSSGGRGRAHGYGSLAQHAARATLRAVTTRGGSRARGAGAAPGWLAGAPRRCAGGDHRACRSWEPAARCDAGVVAPIRGQICSRTRWAQFYGGGRPRASRSRQARPAAGVRAPDLLDTHRAAVVRASCDE
ncbi:hypothetical protein WOLCODRAFT_164281 [Wolfiporia cocos MD-104 SS10]|uniref:Uncharacterized protein n=1 Tax=Wolfiporia cocos (strain MD-104) TaxID=742152 RepID=A0A2H3JMP7_WOLCO|nr:hypothetical protein WOLCODRAFT_164281 [Wolfiporia cocos MD-104 SS10]